MEVSKLVKLLGKDFIVDGFREHSKASEKYVDIKILKKTKLFGRAQFLSNIAELVFLSGQKRNLPNTLRELNIVLVKNKSLSLLSRKEKCGNCRMVNFRERR